MDRGKGQRGLGVRGILQVFDVFEIRFKNHLARVDEYGFFIYWKSEGREGDVKELSQVNDIRQGELPKVFIYNICEE